MRPWSWLEQTQTCLFGVFVKQLFQNPKDIFDCAWAVPPKTILYTPKNIPEYVWECSGFLLKIDYEITLVTLVRLVLTMSTVVPKSQ